MKQNQSIYFMVQREKKFKKDTEKDSEPYEINYLFISFQILSKLVFNNM